MLFNKADLKKYLKENKISSTDDFNELMKNISKEIIEAIYDGEITSLLGYEKHDYSKKQTDNNRNGYSKKNVQSKYGNIELNIPRDRKAQYEPEIVKKYQNDITGIEEKIISMYAKGMTDRDISSHIEEIYGHPVSAEKVSYITDKVKEKAIEWQNRVLEEIYTIIYMDALFFKVRTDGKVIKIAVYGIIGITIEGKKDCLGLWLMESEGAKFWLNVLNELKNRGVKDILIFSIDGLTGLSDAIRASFPNSEIQRCIVHQIRNSLKHVPWKDMKKVAKDLKLIYSSATEELALSELDKFKETWNSKYPNIYTSWISHWDELSTFFKYPTEIRKLIYTTNPIESFNKSLRKTTKNRGVFPSNDSLFKLLFLSIQDISKKWSQKIKNWGLIFPQLCIYFKEIIYKYVS